MLRLIWRQTVNTGSRAVALVLGIFVAVTGFVLLTTQSDVSRLELRGFVSAHSRPIYDILVRPRAASTAIERVRGLVQAQFLAGVYGGISMSQLATIRDIPGVQVAAPISVLGYVVPRVRVWVDVTPSMGSAGRSLARVVVQWKTDNGLSREKAIPGYVYVTGNRLTLPKGTSQIQEVTPQGRKQVCSYSTDQGTTVAAQPPEFWCWSRQPSAGPISRPVGVSSRAYGLELAWPVPFVLAGIDPGSEAQLDGLSKAVLTGSYLNGQSVSTGRFKTVIPVIAGSQPVTNLTASVTVERLSAAAIATVADGASPFKLAAARGVPITHHDIKETSAYQDLLRSLASPPSFQTAQLVDRYWTVSAARLTSMKGGMRVSPARVPPTAWGELSGGDENGSLVPAGADDTAFRALEPHVQLAGGEESTQPTLLHLVGVFDAKRLPGFRSLEAVPLGTFANPPITGADKRSRQLLGDRPLAASPNIAAYPQTPPLLLTTLDGSDAMLRSGRSSNAAAPISSIRIRVAHVHGIDNLSRERVRTVAQGIRERTGLSVDITVGSSPAAQLISLPAGRNGRPALRLHENWVRKGVAQTIVAALDRKSLVLFTLVLIVCALFVGNTAAASVQARRTELGMLACLGWRQRQLFALVAVQILLLATASGVLAAGLSTVVGSVTGVHVSVTRAALAIPAALFIALAAGGIPAIRAARAEPMEAIQPAIRLGTTVRTAKSVVQLAWVNVRRTPARSIIAGAGISVAVAALTLLVAIVLAFRDSLVGSILGSAVTVQVRLADWLATAAMMGLAAMGIGNVVFLNIRERGSELATLQAIGWRPRAISRLIATEGTLIGMIASVVGAGVGLSIAAAFSAALTSQEILAAVVAAVLGALLSVVASTVPTLWLRRLTTAQLLTEQ